MPRLGGYERTVNIGTADNTERYSMRTGKRRISGLLPIVFAALCLVWVFHSVDLSELARQTAVVDFRLAAAAVALDVLSYVVQGGRWALLLRPFGRLSVFSATRAIYAGLFANEVLPLKIGEGVRCFLAASLLKTGPLSIIPTIILERFFDGVWLVAGIGVTAAFVHLPPSLMKTEEMLGALIVVSTGIFLLVVKKGLDSPTLPDPPNVRPRSNSAMFAPSLIKDSLRSIHAAAAHPAALAAFFLSLMLILAQACSFWLVMRAYAIDLPFWAGTAVFFIVHLGTALPGTPANVGSYQFFTVLGLALFGVDRTLAVGFSVFVFLLLTIPLWVLGFLAMSSSGITLSAVRREVGRFRFRTTGPE